MPSPPAVIVKVPPQIETESFTSMPLPSALMIHVPPVALKSSLAAMPWSVELIVRVPRPFRTRSSLEKITASVLVSPSAVKVPVTERVLSLPSAVVTKTLSALFT